MNTEPWTCERYHYTIMEKDGKFQWRWLPPLPPEVKDAAISPVFDSVESAIEWKKRSAPLCREEIRFANWKPVTF